VGGLVGLGIPEIEASRYEEKLKKGNYLIAEHTDEAKMLSGRRVGLGSTQCHMKSGAAMTGQSAKFSMAARFF
jgi:hypothetical protein